MTINRDFIETFEDYEINGGFWCAAELAREFEVFWGCYPELDQAFVNYYGAKPETDHEKAAFMRTVAAKW